jgi:hypothetical protein
MDFSIKPPKERLAVNTVGMRIFKRFPVTMYLGQPIDREKYKYNESHADRDFILQ